MEKVEKNMLNVYICANFLVQMYYQIEKKYNLERIKLERLLAIVELRYMAQKKQRLFGDSLVLTYNETLEYRMYAWFPPSIVTGEEHASNNSLPISVEMVEKALADIPKFPCGYEVSILDGEKELFDQVRMWFIDAFIQFGDYESFILKYAIDEFKDEITCEKNAFSSNIRKIVSTQKVYEFFRRDFYSLENINGSKTKEELKEQKELERKLKKVALKNGLEIEKLEEFFEINRKEEEERIKAVERACREIVKFVQSK